jgi:Zn-dependent protease
MPRPPVEKFVATSYPSPDRLWAEQLAIGSGLLVAVLIFMAIFHAKMLSSGAEVLGPNDLDAYGWASIVGIVLQVVVHELGTILMAWRLKLPIRLRFFGFGANATAILEDRPRDAWTDARVGFAGPITGTVVSLILHGIYEITKAQDSSMHIGNPFFLGMACVGYFYNLFTLIPILDLEGGWIAPALAPQAWLLGLMLSAFRLAAGFNLVLLCVVTFAVPRFVLLLRARAPRTDVACTTPQRFIVAVLYFFLVIGLAWVGSKTFDVLPELVRTSMGD